MNEDGDWWVEVEGKSFADARREILWCLSYEVPDEGTLVYKGKHRTILCDKHTADEIPCCCDSTCMRNVLAYYFVENRKW